MTDDLIHIPGIATSAEIRAQLADAGDPIFLAFSGGKDSIAAWIALLDAGVTVVPNFMYLIPGLRHTDETIDRFEQHFGTRLERYPHPSLYRMLNGLVFQPPERIAAIEAANLPNVEYEQIVQFLREDHDMPDAWVADGVRAADSIIRRVSIKKHGPMKEASRKVSPVWDWRKRHVLDAIAADGLQLPPEYDWFGRSFDGIDYRFLEPLKRLRPDDYAMVLEWFPLADLELFRHGL